jgi:hypothetical protein
VASLPQPERENVAQFKHILPVPECGEERCSFLKKRTKKLLAMAYASGESTASQKSFASFLQK